MDNAVALWWLRQGYRRQLLLCALYQPMTATQLSGHVHLAHNKTARRDVVSDVLMELRDAHLIICVNPRARVSRLYWHSAQGAQCQAQLYAEKGIEQPSHDFEMEDWHAYGWVLFRHRQLILKSLTQPKRQWRIKDWMRKVAHQKRIGKEEICRILQGMVAKGIVHRFYACKEKHPRFELTRLGQQCLELVRRAETPELFARYDSFEKRIDEI